MTHLMPMKHLLVSLALLFGAAAPLTAQSLPEWGETYTPEAPADFGGDIHGPGLPDAPDAVPIDGGLGLLGAAGAAYALNRLRKRREEKLEVRS